MKAQTIVLIILQVTPILVLLLSLTHPHLVTPIFIFLIILFPIFLFKFFQQATNDFERELYSKEQPKTEFKTWYGVPFTFEEPSQEPPLNPLEPYLQILRLPFPYTLDRLNRAYRKRARETHPDVPGGSEREFIRVREAYEVLKIALDSQESNTKEN
jgi:DnaJ domain